MNKVESIIFKTMEYIYNNDLFACTDLERKPFWLLDDKCIIDSTTLYKIKSAYDLMDDEESKNLFLWQLSSVIMQVFTNSIATINGFLADPCRREDIDYMFSSLAKKISNNSYSINGYSIETHKGILKEIWVANNYDINLPNVDITKCKVIIDGGAYKGESSIWFTHKAPNSSVYSFEILPDAIEALNRNIESNNLTKRIKVIEKALWDCNTSIPIYYNDVTSGVVKQKTADNINIEVETISLDSFSKEYALNKIDLIKLDIEGSEYNALCGMKDIIREMHPYLIIALYHKISDFVEIPLLINSICDSYRFSCVKKLKGNGEILLYCI